MKRSLSGWVLLLAVALVPMAVFAIPESVRIPVVEDHDGEPEHPALFDHWTHDQYRCYACHPGIFPQRKLGFTHDDMDKGLYCGACHDGINAFHPDDDEVECEHCHR